MSEELTIEILEEAISKLPPSPRIKQIHISPSDYLKMREACDMFRIFPEQPEGFTYGFLGERIIPDANIKDHHYKIDWEEL